MRCLIVPSLALITTLLVAMPAAAMFAQPIPTPVDRIITNAGAYIAEHPDDARGHYVLGRAHYLAWTLKSRYVPVHRWSPRDMTQLPNLVERWQLRDSIRRSDLLRGEALNRVHEAEATEPSDDRGTAAANDMAERVRIMEKQLEAKNWQPEPVTQEELDAHAEAAIRGHRRAIELDPADGLYELGLGSILEQYALRAAERGLTPDVQSPDAADGDVSAERWQLDALTAYARAYDLSITGDQRLNERPIAGLGKLVSYNAIRSYLALAERLGGDPLDAGLAEVMRADLVKVKKLRTTAITPIIFSLDPAAARLADLLMPDAVVSFDLDGDGVAERRPWVQPETAILVWDPLHDGRITSGQQLFGSVTWWLMPGDGYRAMALLDDDRNGELAGAELFGLAVWFDLDGSGTSDPGEVVPIERAAVAGLRVEALSEDAGSPMHPDGLRLRDGRTLPTWDWIATPAAP